MSNHAKPSLKTSGRFGYRVRGLLNLMRCSAKVLVRRTFRGPRLPDWPFLFEFGTEFMRSQNETAFDMPAIEQGREYLDAVLFSLPVVSEVAIEPVTGDVKGSWYTPKAGHGDTVVLYLHGGGYAFYTQGHANILAQATVSCRAKTFALDYRLAPEHPYPAQLEDAVAAYRWLLDSGTRAENIVVMGDSAGGNLTLALLLKLRELDLPQPAGAAPLCPWTDVANCISPYQAMEAHDRFDFPQSRMVPVWGGWFIGSHSADDPLISPIYADLTGLAPIYIQVGGKEILYDQIVRFVDQAELQNANVRLDTWPTMNHDFQAYGDDLPHSREAWQRLAEFAETCVAVASASELRTVAICNL